MMRITAFSMAEPNESGGAGEYAKRTHSKSIRFKSSISSDKVPSAVTSP
jgi:hypothetical protein